MKEQLVRYLTRRIAISIQNYDTLEDRGTVRELKKEGRNIEAPNALYPGVKPIGSIHETILKVDNFIERLILEGLLYTLTRESYIDYR